MQTTFSEANRIKRQRYSILASSVKGWHTPGHDGVAVGLAHTRSDVKAVKTPSLGRNGVNIRRTQDRVAVAAQVVRTLLVGDDEQKIRFFCLHEDVLGEWVSGKVKSASNSLIPPMSPRR